MITGFEALDPDGSEVNVKPALQEVLAGLPATLRAKLGDEDTADVAVTWSCDGYADRADGDFVFTAALADDTAYALGEGVSLPTYTLKVVRLIAEKFVYALDADGNATLTEWLGDGTSVTTPEKVDGHPVVALGDGLFKDQDKLETVTLSKGLLAIGGNAFENCKALKEVTIPDSLERVGADLFKGISDAVMEELIVTLRADLTQERESKLTDEKSFCHKNIDEETREEKTVSVTLPIAITDIAVNEGTLTLDTDFTVEAENKVTVAAQGTLNVAAGRTLKNTGSVSNQGALNVEGKLVTCGGSYSGGDPALSGEGSYVDYHVYQKGVCTGCGAAEPVYPLTVAYNGSGVSKTYDGKNSASVGKDKLSLNGVVSGEDVYISGVSASYDNVNAGARTVTVNVTLGGADAGHYTVEPLKLNGTITPRNVTINPVAGQGKTYGASDPSSFGATVNINDIVKGDRMTGALGRERGEDAGQYRITLGTLSAGDNYVLKVSDGSFTIRKKDVNAKDVSPAPLGNQRYTGEAVTPSVVLHYGNLTLAEGTDYELVYSDNVEPGTGTVTIRGLGNYEGERDLTFRIIKIGTGTMYNGGSSGGSSGRSGGGSSGRSGGGSSGRSGGGSGGSGSGSSEDDGSLGYSEKNPLAGRLILEGFDYGAILFNEDDEPRSFTQHEITLPQEDKAQGEKAGNGEDKLRLVIEADPLTDKTTGETSKLADGRDAYERLHLKMTPTIVRVIREYGVSELVYKLDDAELRIPIDSLVSEIELPMEDENASEGMIAISAPRAEVQLYDIAIFQAEESALSEREASFIGDVDALTNLYRLEAKIEVSEDEETREALDYVEGAKLYLPAKQPVEEENRRFYATYCINDLPALSHSEAVQSEATEFVEEEDPQGVQAPRLYGAADAKAEGLYLVGFNPDAGEGE